MLLVKHVGSECVSERGQEKQTKKSCCSVHKKHYLLLYNSYIPMSGLWNKEKHETVLFLLLLTYLSTSLSIYLPTIYLPIYLSIYQITYLLENCVLPGYYIVRSGNNPEECSSQLMMYLFIHLFILLLSIHPTIHSFIYLPTQPPTYLPTYQPTCLPACLYLFIYFICLFYRSLDNSDHSSDFICPLTVNNILEKMW